jgi:saccharopine dehydrogenase-like NADP-dependent oxidoreductase
MRRILVLGAGMVGSAMAIDLAKKYQVTVFDKSEDALFKIKQKNSTIETASKDVTNKKHLEFEMFRLKPDLVVCAVPGFLGYETLKTIIECRINVVDISFFPENALELNDLAIQYGVTAIVDCGVAPGLDNMILGYENTKMDITDFECLVGGLPKIKKWPFNYKAPFSPVDVIEEYTRPARYVENGNVVIKEALSDCEYINFENVGTLESFNSDGLRSLIYTMSHIKNMKEKTLRYPGHVDLIKALKDSGFFSKEPLIVKSKMMGENNMSLDDVWVSPLDVTSKILFKEWRLEENEEELTVMRVTVAGTEKDTGKKIRTVYHLHDEFNKETGTSSMARTTGYTATAIAEIVALDLFQSKGVFPPEVVMNSNPRLFNKALQYLYERGIQLKEQTTYLD